MNFIAIVTVGWYPETDDKEITIKLSQFSDDYFLDFARQFEFEHYRNYERQFAGAYSSASRQDARYGRDVYAFCRDNVSPRFFVTLAKLVEAYTLYHGQSFGVPTDVSIREDFPQGYFLGEPVYNPEDPE